MTTLEQHVAGIYAQQVRDRSRNNAVHRAEVFEESEQVIIAMLERGDVREVYGQLARSMLQAVDRKMKGRADRVVQRTLDGELDAATLSDGYSESVSLLDTVVTLGGGMRKSWRYVQEHDVDLMHEQRQANARAASRAFRNVWTPQKHRLASVLRDYPDVETAALAGAFVPSRTSLITIIKPEDSSYV